MKKRGVILTAFVIAVLITAAFVAARLTDVRNTFEVHIEDRDAASAQLSICGIQTSLNGKGRNFSGSRKIHCEGEGELWIRFIKGPSVRCPIGYVTNGAEQDFRYVVKGRACTPI